MSFGIYETVTNRIIAELEAGAIPWTQPWKNQKSGGVMPLNRATGRPYSGINIPILWGAASAFGYPTHQWLTFKQALDMKACVKKGEKGTQVVFTKRIPRDDDEEHGTISMLKTFYVFNVQQIDGLERIPTPELVDIDEGDVNQLADRFIAATKADIRIGGSKACFVPSQDFIAMPPREAFEQDSSSTGSARTCSTPTPIFADEVLSLVDKAPASVRWFVLDAGTVTDLDYSAALTVRDLLGELTAKNVGVAFARVSAYLRVDLDRHGISAKVGEARIFATLHEALAAVRTGGSLAGPE